MQNTCSAHPDTVAVRYQSCGGQGWNTLTYHQLMEQVKVRTRPTQQQHKIPIPVWSGCWPGPAPAGISSPPLARCDQWLLLKSGSHLSSGRGLCWVTTDNNNILRWPNILANHHRLSRKNANLLGDIFYFFGRFLEVTSLWGNKPSAIGCWMNRAFLE